VRFPTLKHAAFAVPSSTLSARCFITPRRQPATTFWVTDSSYGRQGSLSLRLTVMKHDLFGYTVTAISIILNMALYAAAVMLLWFIGLDCSPRRDRQTLISRRISRASGNRLALLIRSCDGGPPRRPADPWQKVTALQNKQYEREFYEKTSLNSSGGKWIGNCSRTTFRRSAHCLGSHTRGT
jgi:hypothetical protein